MRAHPSSPRARGRRPLGAAVLAVPGVVAAAALAGCGADPDGFNDADVTFASDMTQHHAQTVQLVNLPLRHDVASEDAAWTDDARARRFAELKSFAGLLRSWGEDVPDTGLEHSDEGKHLTFDAEIPGVLTDEEMHTLQQGADGAFTKVWLEALIRHEQGAVAMAEAEIADGQNAEAVEMARKDKAKHAALVAELQRLAGS